MRIRRSYVRRTTLFLVATVFTIAVVAPAGQFFISLAEEGGWYQNPSAKLRAVIAFFAAIASSPLFHWIGGAIIGLAGGVWLDAILKRRNDGEGLIYPADKATVMAVGNIQNFITPPHVALTFEEKQFRLELRKFVSSLDDAYGKLGRVFGDLLQIDQNNNQDAHENERFFASSSTCIIGNSASIDSLKSLTQVNVDEMDANAIELATVSFITNNYRLWQLWVWRFNQIAKIDIDHLDSLRRWLDADGRCATALHELQSYCPSSEFLGQGAA